MLENLSVLRFEGVKSFNFYNFWLFNGICSLNIVVEKFCPFNLQFMQIYWPSVPVKLLYRLLKATNYNQNILHEYSIFKLNKNEVKSCIKIPRYQPNDDK